MVHQHGPGCDHDHSHQSHDSSGKRRRTLPSWIGSIPLCIIVCLMIAGSYGFLHGAVVLSLLGGSGSSYGAGGRAVGYGAVRSARSAKRKKNHLRTGIKELEEP